MARTAAKQQPTPVPTTQNAGQKQTAITQNDRAVASQLATPFPAPQKVELQRPTISEADVRLRAYEIYFERGDRPGDEIGDWLQAERELLGG